MSQYALPLSFTPVYTRDNFLVRPQNEAAFRWLENWPNWPNRALWLHGPEGSGKTHLAHLWLEKSAGNPADLAQTPAPGHWLIEDISEATDPRALLHWLNYVREQEGTLLLTSRHAPASLPFTLNDLTSRLKALPAASLPEADDELIEAALRKQLMDRQLMVDEEVIAYLLPRMERSLAQAARMAARIDAAALEQRRHVTIPFIRKLLEA